MGTRLLALVLALGAASCLGPGPVNPVQAADCEAAGDRLATLGCPEATTPAGNPFAVACHAASADGRNWHPECIAQVTDCSQVATAFRGCL